MEANNAKPLAGKRVLLLAVKTGYQTRQFVRAAEKLGLRVSFGTDRCHRMDDPWGDHAIPLHYHEPQQAARQLAEFAQGNPVEAVVAIGDRPTPAATWTCRELGLPSNPPESAEVCRDKHKSRQRLRAAGLRVPSYKQFPIDTDASTIAAEAGFPCVLKPLALSGSRGVIRANNREEFTKAFDRIRCLLERPEVQVLRDEANRFIQVENYIPGREVALEGLLTHGQLQTLALFDKPDPLDGPFFEETIYVTPSRLPEDIQIQVRETTQQAVTALGLTHGPIHAEMRLNDDGVWVLEVAARCIGGLCARALRFQDGASLEEVILRHALGEDLTTTEREEQAAGVMMIPIPEAGFYETVEGTEAASEVLGIEEVVITAKPGQKLEPLPEGASYLGFIFARAQTPAAAEDALRQAHAKLNFQFNPVLPLVGKA